MLVRDPVHGDIYLTERQRKILDTADIQRLRGIKQLGMGYMVYPGAVHTRFEHSLGTAHMTWRILSSVRHRRPELVSDEDMERAGVVALVHDITHIPYGHTFEDEMRIFDRHDRRDRYERFFSESDTGSVLDSMGLYELVMDSLTSKNELALEDPWIPQVVTKTVCADLLDYIRRDSYFTGLNKDYDDRLFHFMDLYRDDEGRKRFLMDISKRNILRQDVLSEILHLLKIRYFLTERVYYHHTKVSAGAMISKALTIARNDYGLRKEDLFHMTDAQMVSHIRALDTEGRIKAILDSLDRRELLKRAYVLTPHSIEVGSSEWFWLISEYHYPTGAREKAEREIAEEAGTDPDSVCVYCMGPTHFKEAKVDVLLPEGVRSLDEVEDVPELDEMKRLYEHLWRFYVFAPSDRVEAVAEAAESVIGLKNQYRPHSSK